MGAHESASPFGKFAAAWRRLGLAQSGQPIQLTHALKVTGGMAGREPCQANRERLLRFAESFWYVWRLRAYSDFRELLEKQKDLDAVLVHHGQSARGVSAAAMKKRKHVFAKNR